MDRQIIRSKLKTGLRTAQTYLPWLADAKARGQRTIRRILRRPFESDFKAIPLLGLPPSSLYLDIGANRGQTIDALQLMAVSPRIVAFEANPHLAQRLVDRHRGDPSVEVHALAVADAAGEFTLHIPSYRGYVFDGLASLDVEKARDWLRTRIWRFDESKLDVRTVRCTAVRLDDLDLAPQFMKLDIQGLEHEAIVGAAATIERHRPVILVESPAEETKVLLGGLGYRAFSFDGRRLVPGSGARANTFFIVEAESARGCGAP